MLFYNPILKYDNTIEDKEISKIRVMGSDPERWPMALSVNDIESIRATIYGHPDDYAEKTYGTKDSGEQGPLATESKRFISQHIIAEQTAISHALKASPPYTKTILDLGCRDGRLFAELIKPGLDRGVNFKNYFGVELDEQALALLSRRLAYDPTAHAILGDITQLGEVLSQINQEPNKYNLTIESPIACVLQNTLGTIEGEEGWEAVITQLALLLDNYPHTEIILSLYRAINPALSPDEIKGVFKIFEKYGKVDSELGRSKLQEAVELLGNGWLLPSYLYTQSQNGWPPDPEKLTKNLLHIPRTNYVSRHWSKTDILNITDMLGAEVINKQKRDEFTVLRLRKS